MYMSDGTILAHVPTTLKQFKILARLGRGPSMSLFDDIEGGTEFYFSEEDYLSQEELNTGLAPLGPSGKRAARKAARASAGGSGSGTAGPASPATPLSKPTPQSIKYETSPTPGPSSALTSASAFSGASVAGPSRFLQKIGRAHV